MKKLFIFFAFLINTIFFNIVNSKQAYEKIETITVVTENFPPFQYKYDGEIVGPMYEVMKAICVEAKVNCIITMMPWSETLKLSESGRADVIFSIVLGEPSRELFFITSPPIIKSSYSFFTTSTNDWLWDGNISKLDNMVIGAYGPSGTSITASNLLSNNNNVDFKLEKSNLMAVNNLVLGAYGKQSAIVMNTDVGKALLKSNNVKGLKEAGIIRNINYGFGISKASSNLNTATSLIKAFTKLKKDGEIKKILSKYDIVEY